MAGTTRGSLDGVPPPSSALAVHCARKNRILNDQPSRTSRIRAGIAGKATARSISIICIAVSTGPQPKTSTAGMTTATSPCVESASTVTVEPNTGWSCRPSRQSETDERALCFFFLSLSLQHPPLATAVPRPSSLLVIQVIHAQSRRRESRERRRGAGGAWQRQRVVAHAVAPHSSPSRGCREPDRRHATVHPHCEHESEVGAQAQARSNLSSHWQEGALRIEAQDTTAKLSVAHLHGDDTTTRIAQSHQPQPRR